MNLSELGPDAFDQMVDEIMAQGFDEATAATYAAMIGDTPTYAPDGMLIVMEGNREVARIRPLKCIG